MSRALRSMHYLRVVSKRAAPTHSARHPSSCAPDRVPEQPHLANPPDQPVRILEGWGRQLCRKGQGSTLSIRSAQAAQPIARRSRPISRIHPASRFEVLKVGDATVSKRADPTHSVRRPQAARPIACRSSPISRIQPATRFEFLKLGDATSCQRVAATCGRTRPFLRPDCPRTVPVLRADASPIAKPRRGGELRPCGWVLGPSWEGL